MEIVNSNFSIKLIKKENICDVNKLHGEYYPRRSKPITINWEFFNENLSRSGIIVGAYKDNELVGTQAFIPILGSYGEREILSYKSELTLIRKEYRGKGMFEDMYGYGINSCTENGGKCIWGFTSAVKPFSHVGFKIVGPLYDEYLILNPLKLFMARKGIKNFEVEETIQTDISFIENNQKYEKGLFLLKKEKQYLMYRYIENPWRKIASFDAEYGCLYSFDPDYPHYIYLSEVSDLNRAILSIRKQIWSRKKKWICISRFCNYPIFKFGTLLGALPLKRVSNMKMVFMWLGEYGSTTTPNFIIEEGYKEGV